jgi:hypothetical protein
MLNLKLVLPMMAPFPVEEALSCLHDEALAELETLATLKPLDATFGGSNVRISVFDDPSQEPLLTDLWEAPYEVRQYRFLVLEIDGQTCADSIRRDIDASADLRFTEQGAIHLAETIAIDHLKFEANAVLLLANILRPGSLSAETGYAFVGSAQVGQTSPFFAEHLFWAVDTSKQLGWPKLSKVDFSCGWNWLHRSEALVDGIGVGRLGRALAALSHLTATSLNTTSSIDLVWILLGLEALYSKGNIGLKEQLLGKSEALLGKRTENKKAFGSVYDFRSRLLHGDVDLPLRFTEFDGAKKYEDFHTELARNEDLALAVLIATLQWMMANNTTSLKFEYALATGGDS